MILNTLRQRGGYDGLALSFLLISYYGAFLPSRGMESPKLHFPDLFAAKVLGEDMAVPIKWLHLRFRRQKSNGGHLLAVLTFSIGNIVMETLKTSAVTFQDLAISCEVIQRPLERWCLPVPGIAATVVCSSILTVLVMAS